MSKKGIRHRRWSKEEKLKIVGLHMDDHMTIRQIEKEYGIHNSLVTAWVKKYLEEGEAALEPHKHKGNPYAALHTSKSLSEVERLRLIVAKQEVEIARLKKDIGWKELVQARNTLLAAERLRSYRRTSGEVSGRLSLPDHGRQPFRILQMAEQKRKTESL